MEAEQILATLPWRPPFLMIDRLVECTPHQRIVTRKGITAGDPLAAPVGGGPGRFPSLLLVEGMGQAAALLFRISRPLDAAGTLPMLGYLKVEFFGSASPGDAVLFDVRSVKMTATGGVFEARALLGDSLLAQAELAFGKARASGETRDEEQGMQLDFDPGVALVAGGSGGIGAAVVRCLAQHGVPVAFTYHRARAAADELLRGAPAGAPLAAYAWSSAGLDEALSLVGQVERDLGPVRFLVAASGIGQQAALHRLGEDEARRIVDTNLTAVISLARATVPAMLKAGQGRVVLIGSVAGSQGMKGQTVYAATKAALEGFTRALAREAGMFGVTVNCVAPGFIETQMTAGLPPRLREEWIGRIALGRAGQPEEVARVVAFVLSREAAYVTGQTLRVDGGLSA